MKKTKIALILSSFTLAIGVCTFSSLSTKKETSSVVSEAWSLDVTPNVDVSYYSAADGKTGSALKTALAGFNKPVSPSYDWSRYEAADEAQDDSTSIFCVYTRHNIKKNSHCGSYSWDTWNREHVYTQSAFPNSDKDNHNIFACEGQINNYRSSLKYDEVKDKGGSRITVFGHVTDCYYIKSTSFEPCDEAKGEIARACLYCTVYYGYNLSSIFVSTDVALEWNAKYTVTPREIYRNNVVYGLQGNRNPFIDHPSYAQAIYGGPAYEGVDPLGGETPKSVTISQSSASLIVGNTLNLTASASDSSAITWSTSNNLVATVTQSGVVSAVKAGTATITASATIDGDVYSASCEVTVSASKELSSIEVSNPKTSFTVDDPFSFGGTVTAHFNDSTTSDVTASATFSGYDMSTSGNQIVTVSYTYGSNTKTTEYQINVKKSGGGGGGEETYTITYTDLPKSYSTTDTVYTAASGIKFQAYNCAGGYSNKMQFKSNSGYLQTTEALELQSITINNRESNTLTVYGSNTVGSFSTAITGANDVYDLTGYSYFKVARAASGVAYCASLTIVVGSSEPTEPTSISAFLKEDKTFYVGETISRSDIYVVTDLDEDVTSEVEFPDYQFKYSDSSGGGLLADKEFDITYSDLPSTTLTVEVQRKAYEAPTGVSSFDIVSSTVFKDIGGGSASLQSGTVEYEGITYQYKEAYYYNSGKVISFGNASEQAGHIVNLTAFPTAISDVTVTSTGREVNVRYSEDGSSWVLKDDADTDDYDYRYMKVDCIGNTGSSFSNISKITVTLKAGDTAVNVSNYIMFEDTNNQCLTKLNIAIGYLNTMSSDELNTFQTSEDYVISTARDRLEAWARNQGKTIDYSGESEVSLSSALVNELTENLESSNALILIIACALGSMLCLSTLLIIKKKKRK